MEICVYLQTEPCKRDMTTKKNESDHYLVTEMGFIPFAKESVDHDKLLIYERIN